MTLRNWQGTGARVEISTDIPPHFIYNPDKEFGSDKGGKK